MSIPSTPCRATKSGFSDAVRVREWVGRCKPDSVPAIAGVAAVISLDADLAARAPRLRGVRLIPEGFLPLARGCGQAGLSSVLSCTAWGLSCLLPRGRSGELLPRLFTLAARIAPHGGMFSVTLSVTGGLRRQPPPLRAARCLAVSGLSSPKRLAANGSDSPRPTREHCKGVLVIGKDVVRQCLRFRGHDHPLPTDSPTSDF